MHKVLIHASLCGTLLGRSLAHSTQNCTPWLRGLGAKCAVGRFNNHLPEKHGAGGKRAAAAVLPSAIRPTDRPARQGRDARQRALARLHGWGDGIKPDDREASDEHIIILDLNLETCKIYKSLDELFCSVNLAG